MLAEIYHLAISFSRIRAQRLGADGFRLFFAYLRLRINHGWLRATGQNKRYETFLGFRVRCFDYASFVYLVEEIFVNGTYRFTPNRRQPVILDCGSNIGVSILYFKWRFPESKIVGFEANPSTFAVLEENVKQNNLRDVELHNVALAENDGLTVFHSDRDGSLSASVLAGRRSTPIEVRQVNCRALSGLIGDRVDFLKMDIEGAEGVCLPEIARSGRLAHVDQIVVECHHNLDGDPRILSRVMSTLEAHDFRYRVSSMLPPESASQDVVLYANRQV